MAVTGIKTGNLDHSRSKIPDLVTDWIAWYIPGFRMRRTCVEAKRVESTRGISE